MREIIQNNISRQRIHHIDAMRAFAILMMLQGHFIYTMMDLAYFDSENSWYLIWKFCRGFTAPIFFTVTGIILIYLLFKKNDEAYREKRLKKGVKRGFYLIFWGYLLRLNFSGLFYGQINQSFWWLDVLHCIGLAMILMMGLYRLLKPLPIAIYQGILLLLSMLIFVTEPLLANLSLESVPVFLQPFINRTSGSIFTPFPWVGYTIFGGFLGTIYSGLYRTDFSKRLLFGGLFAGVGIWLTYQSSNFLMDVHRFGICDVCKAAAYNNYLFIRLGNVLVINAFFIFFEPIFAQMRWFSKIGQQTLNIYIVHVIILFKTFFGFGLAYNFSHSLPPIPAIIGAIIFMGIATIIGVNINPMKNWLSKQLPIIRTKSANYINRVKLERTNT